MVLTWLKPKRGEWVDTGVVNRLLSKAENHERLKDLMASLKEFGAFKRPRPGPKISREKRTELAHEHAQVRAKLPEVFGDQNDQVPF